MTTARIGMLLFPRMTQLDLTGPFEVFADCPARTCCCCRRRCSRSRRKPVCACCRTATLPDCPQLDVVCVPGGPGVAALMEDDEVLEWLRGQAQDARYISSVCTGALVLGAAGLLRGKRATTHWARTIC